MEQEQQRRGEEQMAGSDVSEQNAGIKFKDGSEKTMKQGQGRTEEHHSGTQEAHGPRFAHLSDIATADMQMLCNIYPILSSQLMKISSFEQFLVLKKNIWAWQSMEHDHE